MDAIRPDIMTHGHLTKQRNGRYVEKRRIYEVKTMRVDTRGTIYSGGKPTKQAVKKRVMSSTAKY